MAANSHADKDKPAVLQAVYQSPPQSQDTATPAPTVFAQQLSTAISPSGDHTPAERTAYLSELRGSIVKLQADVNAFLTEKMEDDKREAQGGGGTAATDDKKEEDTYGEEVVDDGDE